MHLTSSDTVTVSCAKEGHHINTLGSPGGSVVKNPPANARDTGDAGSIPESERSPGEGSGNPLRYSCLENPMDRSLAGYSPWSHKESDMTEVT